KINLQSQAHGTELTMSNDVTVSDDGAKLLLTTDKPIYKPGQIMHLRALNLGRDTSQPVAGATLTFEIADGRGNKIFKKDLKTDSYGVAATDFALGPILNEGNFTVRTISGDTKTEKTVQVSQYALPKFDVAIKTEKGWYQPGQTINGTIDSHYFFGK